MVDLNSCDVSPNTLLGQLDGVLSLRIRGTRLDGRIVRIRAQKCSIGGAADCGIRINSSEARPLHCVIFRGRRGIMVRRWAPDTLLNGKSFREAWLQAGDRLTVGPMEFDVLADGMQSHDEPPEDRTPEESAADETSQTNTAFIEPRKIWDAQSHSPQRDASKPIPGTSAERDTDAPSRDGQTFDKASPRPADGHSRQRFGRRDHGRSSFHARRRPHEETDRQDNLLTQLELMERRLDEIERSHHGEEGKINPIPSQPLPHPNSLADDNRCDTDSATETERQTLRAQVELLEGQLAELRAGMDELRLEATQAADLALSESNARREQERSEFEARELKLQQVTAELNAKLDAQRVEIDDHAQFGAQVTSLQAELANKDQVIEDLTVQVEQLVTDADAAQSNQDEMLVELEQQLAKAEHQASEDALQWAALREQLTTDASAQQEAIQVGQDQLVALQNQVECGASELASAQGLLEQQQRQFQECRQDTETQLDLLREKLQFAKHESDALVTENQGLRDELLEAQNDVAERQAQLETIDGLRVQVAQLQTQLDEKQQEQGTQVDLVARLQSENESLSSSLIESQQHNAMLQTAAESVEMQSQQNDAEQALQLEEIDELKASLTRLQTQLDESNTEKESQAELVVQLQSEMESINNALEESHQAVEQAAADRATAEQVVADQSAVQMEAASNVQSQLEEIRKQREISDSRAMELQAEIEAMESDFSSHKEQLAQELAEAVEQAERLREQLEARPDAHGDSDAHTLREDELDALRQELASAKSELAGKDRQSQTISQPSAGEANDDLTSDFDARIADLQEQLESERAKWDADRGWFEAELEARGKLAEETQREKADIERRLVETDEERQQLEIDLMQARQDNAPSNQTLHPPQDEASSALSPKPMEDLVSAVANTAEWQDQQPPEPTADDPPSDANDSLEGITQPSDSDELPPSPRSEGVHEDGIEHPIADDQSKAAESFLNAWRNESVEQSGHDSNESANEDSNECLSENSNESANEDSTFDRKTTSSEDLTSNQPEVDPESPNVDIQPDEMQRDHTQDGSQTQAPQPEPVLSEGVEHFEGVEQGESLAGAEGHWEDPQTGISSPHAGSMGAEDALFAEPGEMGPEAFGNPEPFDGDGSYSYSQPNGFSAAVGEEPGDGLDVQPTFADDASFDGADYSRPGYSAEGYSDSANGIEDSFGAIESAEAGFEQPETAGSSSAGSSSAESDSEEVAFSSLANEAPVNTSDILAKFGVSVEEGDDASTRDSRPLVPVEPPAPVSPESDAWRSAIAEDSEPSENDDDISNYMDSLLKRMRGDESAAESRPRPEEPARSSVAVEASKAESNESSQPESLISDAPLRAEEFVPRHSAPERDVNLKAMRELANHQANKAIVTHEKRSWAESAQGKRFAASLALVVGLLILFFAGFQSIIGYVGVISSFAMSFYWFKQAGKHARTSRRIVVPTDESHAQEVQLRDDAERETAEKEAREQAAAGNHLDEFERAILGK